MEELTALLKYHQHSYVEKGPKVECSIISCLRAFLDMKDLKGTGRIDLHAPFTAEGAMVCLKNKVLSLW